MKRVTYQPLAIAAASAIALAGATTPASAQERLNEGQKHPSARTEQVRRDHHAADLRRKKIMDDRVRTVVRRERKAVIGVVLSPDPQSGVRIAGVTPDSAAAKAGLRSGDRIVSIDGQQVLGSSGELRVENARKLLGDLDTKTPVQLGYLREGRGGVARVTPRLDEQVFLWRGDGPMASGERLPMPPGMAPRIERELIRIGPGGDCKGAKCELPMLAEAFRWNGLNLAAVDAQLGRYFGTDRGVLVLSTGPELLGLQAGDVIRKIDGRPVDTPREAMAALRGGNRAANTVAIDYLRDRKPGSATVKVPAAMPLRIPMPPPPPAPPAPHAAPAPPAPPPPPPPPPRTAFDQAIGIDGERMAFALAPEAPLPPTAPLPPAAPEIVEDIEIETR